MTMHMSPHLPQTQECKWGELSDAFLLKTEKLSFITQTNIPKDKIVNALKHLRKKHDLQTLLSSLR